MNRVELAGGIVRPPDVKVLPSGARTAEFTVAVNEAGWSSEERKMVAQTSYIAVRAFGSVADAVASFGLDKGDEVYVVGKLLQESWLDKDNKRQTKTRVRAAVVIGYPREQLQRAMPLGDDVPFADGEEPF